MAGASTGSATLYIPYLGVALGVLVLAGLFVLGVWAIYRIARGWLALNGHRAMPVA